MVGQSTLIAPESETEDFTEELIGGEDGLVSLSSELLRSAAGVFLRLAYDGTTVPVTRQPFLDIEPGEPIDPLLHPPLCQRLVGDQLDATAFRGYAFRLGSRDFPHVKLQAIWHRGVGQWVFAVDTHDAISLPRNDPDSIRLKDLQAANRRLKHAVENEWEALGLLTFNGLLRQGLAGSRSLAK